MINGTLEEFFEKLLLGEEIWLLWQGRSFLLQGWYDAEEEKQVLNLDDVTPDDAETVSPLWRHPAPTMKENAAVYMPLKCPNQNVTADILAAQCFSIDVDHYEIYLHKFHRKIIEKQLGSMSVL